METKSKFYMWDSYAKKGGNYPFPFDGFPFKRSTYNDPEKTDGQPVRNVAPIQGLIYAAVAAAEAEAREITTYNHIAAGSATSKGGTEVLYTEYASLSYPNLIQIARYDPVSGDLKAGVFNTTDGQIISMKFDGTKKEEALGKITSCEAAWLCILLYALNTVPSISKAFDIISKCVRKELPVDDSSLSEGPVALSWEMYKHLSIREDLRLSLAAGANSFRQLKKQHVESGETGPSKGKRIFGSEYKVFKDEYTPSTSSKEAEDLDMLCSKVSFERTFSDLSEEEKLLIPQIDPKETVTPQLCGIISEVARTWEKDPELQCSRILLEGGSGTGKTYLVRSFAAHLKRPYVTHICGTTDGPDAFQGIIVPYVESEGKKVALLSRKRAEQILANPSLLWPEDIELDIEYDPSEASKRIKSVVDEAKDAIQIAQENAGVRYAYIPSAIVTAVKNGYVLEIQEPTCLIQQGALSVLYDVLDKGSQGVLNTPGGPVKRHKDFICFVTQNRKYKGTKPLNEAARSRFTHIERMEDPSENEILARVKKRTACEDDELLLKSVQLYSLLKERAEDLNCDGVVTLRNLYDFVDCVSETKEIAWAFERKLLNPITTDGDDRADLISYVEDADLLSGLDIR